MKKREMISMFLLLILFLIPIIIAVEDSDTLSGSTGFSVNVKGGMICEDGGTVWRDYTNPEDVIPSNTMGDDSNCYSEFGTNPETGEYDRTCCPSGFSCESIEGDELEPPLFHCVNNGKIFCQDFSESADECTEVVDGEVNGNQDVANVTIESRILDGESLGSCGSSFSWIEGDLDESTCNSVIHCTCIWDSTENTCDTFQNETIECYTEEGAHTSEEVGTCTWELVGEEDHCNDGLGFISMTWNGAPTGDWTEDESCTQGVVQEVSCTSIAMMSFFDESMFIISVSLILIVYLLQLIINKKK